MLGRFFGRLTGGNWRSPAQELAFAASAGFDTVQIRSDRPGEIEDELGVDARTLGALFDDNGLEPVLEMLVRHGGEPGTITRALRANLPAIEAIGFLRVHIHPVGGEELSDVCIVLHSPEGDALLRASAPPLIAFLTRADRLVPMGEELTGGELEAELADILKGCENAG